MTKLIPLIALSAALTACDMGPTTAEDYASVLPDDRVQITLPVEAARRDAREWSEFYLMTAEVTDDVNGLIGGVLHWVDVVTDYEPTWSDTEENTAVWGPWADALDPAETALWVHYDVETDIYTWGINQRPKGEGDDAWVVVVAGQVNEGATSEVSDGWFAIDFDSIHELDPTREATGSFICEYDIALDGVVASAGFDDFSDGGPALDAYYHYEQLFGSTGLMDLARTIDLNPEDGTDLDEVLVIRSRWTEFGEGRADAYVTEGDLGSTVGTATECWDDAFAPVYYTDNFSGTTTGDEAECAFAEPEFSESTES